MKQLIFVLAIISISQAETTAQTSSNAKNYRVCRIDGKYHTCNHDDPLIVITKPEVSKIEAKQASMRKYDTYQRMESTTVAVESNKKNKKFIVTYDEPNGAAQGESTQANGTVEDNKARNINYLNTSNPLPPIDGNNSSLDKSK